jgi:hypothetical protein
MTDNQKRSILSEHAYTQWRRGLGHHHNQYVIDIDQVEYRGEEVVALIDLKAWPDYDNPAYWARVAENQTFAGRMYCKMAGILGCRAYVVFSDIEAGTFMVYGLMDEEGWRRYNMEHYEAWLMSLPEVAL